MSQQIVDKVSGLPKISLVFICGIISIGLALFSSFLLASWAEASNFAHGIQHVLLITAGIGLGGSITIGIKQRKDR